MLRRLFSFKGRIGRKEYAIHFFCDVAYFFILLYAFHALDSHQAGESLTIFFIVLLLLLPAVARQFLASGGKRCHDLNKSRFWQLIPFYIFVMLFRAGDKKRNRYGSAPGRMGIIEALLSAATKFKEDNNWYALASLHILCFGDTGGDIEKILGELKAGQAEKYIRDLERLLNESSDANLNEMMNTFKHPETFDRIIGVKVLLSLANTFKEQRNWNALANLLLLRFGDTDGAFEKVLGELEAGQAEKNVREFERLLKESSDAELNEMVNTIDRHGL
jgi:uncharacterized membrane protein YhaH (DUF805 family)